MGFISVFHGTYIYRILIYLYRLNFLSEDDEEEVEEEVEESEEVKSANGEMETNNSGNSEESD